MMFGLDFAISMLQVVLAAQEADQKQLVAAAASMSPEQFDAYMMHREERQKRERIAATEEHRHRELCDAIRSTGFWRFGG